MKNMKTLAQRGALPRRPLLPLLWRHEPPGPRSAKTRRLRLVANAAVPAPKILVIDRNAILRASKVGQDIVRQVNGIHPRRGVGIPGRGQRTSEGGPRAAAAGRDSGAGREGEEDPRFPGEAGGLSTEGGGAAGADPGRRVQGAAAGGSGARPHSAGHHAGAWRQSCFWTAAQSCLAPVNIDITGVAVQRLDQKMPTVKVDLVALPPAVQAQMQQQAHAPLTAAPLAVADPRFYRNRGPVALARYL